MPTRMTNRVPGNHWRCALAGLLLATGCGGGSGSPGTVDVGGVWRGTVAYDEKSCSSPLVPPESVTGQDFGITISDETVGTDLCPGLAIDQYGQVYELNGASACPVKPDSELAFIPVQQDTGGQSPTRPTGIFFENFRDKSADVTVTYFANLSAAGTCVVVFRGTFNRD